MKMKYAVLLTILPTILFSQEYPRWFLFPGDVKAQWKVVAMVQGSTYQKDSAVALGFRKGCELLAKYSHVEIAGGQAFWATEAGTYAMGSSYTEKFDSTEIPNFMVRSKILDYYADAKKTFVLVGDSASSVDGEMKKNISMKRIQEPSWVESLPESQKYYYGVGLSQEYFYEQSSWMAAEKNAYMSIARTLTISLQELQKNDMIEGQEIRNEELHVMLKDVQIVARWRDVQRKIFYVLARMKK